MKHTLKALLSANNQNYAIWDLNEPYVLMRFHNDGCYERPKSWLESHNGILVNPDEYHFVLEAYTGGSIFFGKTFKECLDFLSVNMRKPIQQLLLETP